MVPLIAQSHIEAHAALRTYTTESCRRDLDKVFVAWLLAKTTLHAEFSSIAEQAAQREGADQDFQTIAILGFAAKTGLLSERQAGALKRGLSRLAGRSSMIDGARMAFSADAVGILGVALGTRSIGDPVVTGQVVEWAAKFLRISYERSGISDWQRCLLAVADRQLGGTLNLPVPESAATADVRTALAAKGLVEVKDGERARADQEQTLALATQEPPKDLDHAALRLAALERVFRVRRPPGGPIFVEDGTMESIDRTSQTGPTWAVAGTQTESTGAERALSTAVPSLEHTAHRNSPDADVDLRPRRRRGRPIEISDELKQKALAVKGGKARAQILYGIRYPTPQQVKNVSSILKHYLGKHKPNEV